MVVEVISIISCLGTLAGATFGGISMFSRSSDIKNLDSIPRILSLASDHLHEGIMLVQDNREVIPYESLKILLVNYNGISKLTEKYFSEEKKLSKLTNIYGRNKLKRAAILAYERSQEFHMEAQRASNSAKIQATFDPGLVEEVMSSTIDAETTQPLPTRRASASASIDVPVELRIRGEPSKPSFAATSSKRSLSATL